MNDQEAWVLEERLWLEGAHLYGTLLSPECVMAFPAPIGIMKGAAITRSLQGAPRWSSVKMTELTIGRPDEETIVLAYRAEGQREGANAYVAFCTSGYRFDNGCWKLVHHQQTPVS